MTAEDLMEINKDLPKQHIKGKEYVMVKDRVTAFRKLCPNGTIESKVVSCQDGEIIITATVRDGYHIFAQGTAWEKKGSNYINATSYVENCETSAIGRALGFMGIGIDDSIGSADEIANAIINQSKDKQDIVKEKISAKDVEDIKSVLVKTNTKEMAILNRYKVERLEDITVEDYYRKLGSDSLKGWVEYEMSRQNG